MGKAILNIFISVLFAFASCDGSNKRGLKLSGTVEIIEVNISSEVPGRIKKINVEEGDRVKRGDILIILEEEKYKLQMEQAEGQMKAIEKNLEALQLNYTNIDKNFERVKKLKEESAIDEAQFDTIRTQRDALLKQIEATRSQLSSVRATFELAKSHLADTEISSPIDGVVLHKLVEAGEVVGAGIPLLTIGDVAKPWIRTYIPQKYIGKIKLGDSASIYSDSFPGREFIGRIIYIAQQEEFTPKNLVTEEERTKMVYGIKISVDNQSEELKPGQYVDVRIRLNE